MNWMNIKILWAVQKCFGHLQFSIHALPTPRPSLNKNICAFTCFLCQHLNCSLNWITSHSYSHKIKPQNMGSINLKVLLLLPPHRHHFLFHFYHSDYHYLSFSCTYTGLHVYFSLSLPNVLYSFWIFHLKSDTGKFDVQKMERKETAGYLKCLEKLTPFSLKVR